MSANIKTALILKQSILYKYFYYGFWINVINCISMAYKIETRIKDLLKERKETKKSLYEHLSMTPPGFDYMLKHDSYTAARLEQIAAYFGMTVDQFTGSTELVSKQEESVKFNSLDKLLEEFVKLREQLAVKDNQIADANKRADGLQRTIDFLISRPGIAAGANFRNDVAANRSVVRMHPATLAAGQVA